MRTREVIVHVEIKSTDAGYRECEREGLACAREMGRVGVE